MMKCKTLRSFPLKETDRSANLPLMLTCFLVWRALTSMLLPYPKLHRYPSFSEDILKGVNETAMIAVGRKSVS